MRIGMFTDTYTPDVSGVVTSIVTLKKALEEHGHEVWIIANRPGLLKTEFDEENHEIRLPGLVLKKLYGYKASSPVHLLLLNQLKEYNFDILHAHSEFGVGIYARMVSKLLHIPMVSTYHTAYEDYTHYINAFDMQSVDKLAKAAIAKLSKLYGETSHALIAPSYKTERMLKRYGISTPIHVIPTGVDLDRFAHPLSTQKRDEMRKAWGINPSDTVLIYLGRVAEEKRIDLLLEAMKPIQPEEAIKLLVVGGGPSLNDLKEKAKQDQTSDRIIFTDKQTPELVPSFYQLGDLFASASTSETQGLTYLEALAAGLPVAACHDEAVADLIHDTENGYFFATAEELTAIIRQYSHLPIESRKAMSVAARTAAQAYSLETFYQKVIALYEETIRYYRELYVLKEIKYKNDTVTLTIANPSNQMDIMVSVDSFMNYGLRRNETLDGEMITALLKEEMLVHAYQGCLKKIAYKDRTVQEIRDWLQDNSMLDQKNIEELLERFQQKGYLDDERYAQTQVTKLLSQLTGPNRIRRELRKKGIADDLINEALSTPENDEQLLAYEYAKKIQNQIKNKSVNSKRAMMKSKLLARGYSNSVIDIAMQKLNFLDDELEEQNTLRKLVQKAKNRYQRKYTGSQLRNRVYRYLAGQGFEQEDIYLVINEMEWENE